MTPHDFIAKWRNVELKERTASHSHFNDLCRLLGIDEPVTADPKGEWFTFEKGATKTSGGEGWADVWRKGCFAWEYKGRAANLEKAYDQLLRYSIALDSPPLLIVSDMERIRIHTNWTNTVQQVREIALADLTNAATRDTLRACFTDPDQLRPTKTRQMVTEDAAREFAALAQRLRGRDNEPHTVAHFVNRLIFCMFAEDVGLLADKMFERMLLASRNRPEQFAGHAAMLFAAMKSGGMVGFETVEWFNGGLFDDDGALPLEADDIENLIAAATLDWSEIDPSILGTLFERGLDPDKRSQLGAHYTDREKIMQIVGPVIAGPLNNEWAATKANIIGLLEPSQRAAEAALHEASLHSELREEVKALASVLADRAQLELFPDFQKQKRVRKLDEIRATLRQTSNALVAARGEANDLFQQWRERLLRFRVLDPACGSGNFLNLSLLALKDIEHRTNLEAEQLGLPREFPRVGPECVLGIELNPYAAELARVSVWIGEIQWMRRNGFDASRNPILRPLGPIECRDAVLATDGTRATWPEADVIVGNPPFLGNKKMISELGEDYTMSLRRAWPHVPHSVDLVCYWFAGAWDRMVSGKLKRAGLVATNSIRGGANREVLKPIVEHGQIFEAWSDETWSVEGAAVRVSIICFDIERTESARLDGSSVKQISADLSFFHSNSDLSNASKLPENADLIFQGVKFVGEFPISPDIARRSLLFSGNPNGKSNSDVIRRWLTGIDITRRPEERWVIDFGNDLSLSDARLYEIPFEHVQRDVKPIRELVRRDVQRVNWWRFGWARPVMRRRLAPFNRYIATPEVAKHRIFVWLERTIVPTGSIYAIARQDDTTFGILHSRFHELWSLRMGTSLEDRPRYTPSTTFETFPFPEGLTPNVPAAQYADDPRAVAIATVAARLNELRENWLNPADLVRREPEVVPGYPDRLIPVSEAAAKVLAKRTLTNLYNARPAWLDHAHRELDQAVADAYGWGDENRAGLLTDDEILARLFRLNQERAGQL
jgi:type II restriction/modification system DNA methylase subunit YeeA